MQNQYLAYGAKIGRLLRTVVLRLAITDKLNYTPKVRIANVQGCLDLAVDIGVCQTHLPRLLDLCVQLDHGSKLTDREESFIALRSEILGTHC